VNRKGQQKGLSNASAGFPLSPRGKGLLFRRKEDLWLSLGGFRMLWILLLQKACWGKQNLLVSRALVKWGPPELGKPL
jgi:hypothetical protein